ncbi:hypothetical protein EVAR_15754_1 [Eumeta japonica]|uniref:Uncharacterized protein n=1 Tax=Eumeta variegata TaxID=151549 RepID=A0A4C1ZBM7_EUMVA|nr:hypothetical protein EVAR_15754_1 [Eumeta japonica]
MNFVSSGLSSAGTQKKSFGDAGSDEQYAYTDFRRWNPKYREEVQEENMKNVFCPRCYQCEETGYLRVDYLRHDKRWTFQRRCYKFWAASHIRVDYPKNDRGEVYSIRKKDSDLSLQIIATTIGIQEEWAILANRKVEMKTANDIGQSVKKDKSETSRKGGSREVMKAMIL